MRQEKRSKFSPIFILTIFAIEELKKKQRDLLSKNRVLLVLIVGNFQIEEGPCLYLVPTFDDRNNSN